MEPIMRLVALGPATKDHGKKVMWANCFHYHNGKAGKQLQELKPCCARSLNCFLVLALIPCRMPPSVIGWISFLWIYPFFATDVKFIFLKTWNRAAPSAFRARVLSFPPRTPYHKANRFVQIKNGAPLALAPADCQIREINDPMTMLLQPTRQPTQHILDLLLLLLLYTGRQGKFSQKRSTNKDLALNFVLRYFFLILQC